MSIFAEREKFLDYFHHELRYLRNAGAAFAKEHPKIAHRLDLHQLGESPDPQVERLLEAFAFLTARLSKDIDDRLPQLAAALLDVLYPQLANPLPSASLAHFQVDGLKIKLTTGYPVPRKTGLTAYTTDGVSCQFQTSYDVTLWPLHVVVAKIVPGDAVPFAAEQRTTSHYLHLKVQSATFDLEALDVKNLVFYLNMDRALAFRFFEALFTQDRAQVIITRSNRVTECLESGNITPIGLSAEETLVPGLPAIHSAGITVQDYFHFPEKFLFFNLVGLDFSQCDGTADIYISLDPQNDLANIVLTPQNFLLGVTPIVNVFRKISDPLRLTHRQTSYRLLADQRREENMEIYRVEKVVGVREANGQEQTYQPYFSFDHQVSEDVSQFWVSQRRRAVREDLPGHDIFLSFVDLAFNPLLPPDETIYAYTLCTNRYLATHIPVNTALEVTEAFPLQQIVMIQRPTSPVYALKDGESLWKLISQLSMGHVSLQSADVLREALRLLSPSSGHHHVDLEKLKDVWVEPTVSRIGEEAWRGFVRGLRVHLVFEDITQGGTSSFLLGLVLREYLAVQASINSFIDVVLHRHDHHGIWKTWPLRLGEQVTL